MGKNILVGLSGGPSVAINSSLAGIISRASREDGIDGIFGAINGIQGVLDDNIVNLLPYSDEKSIKLLLQTPAMAIGSCRKKLTVEEYPLIEKAFNKRNIGMFFYIGGNDSMDTVLKLSAYFKEKGSDIQVIGVPKTVDNDLPVTDHSPGFGSAAKYLYHTMTEVIRDSEIYPVQSVVIVEIMGRDSGWLTISAGLPKFLGRSCSPQIISPPEQAFDEDKFIDRINELLKTEKSIVCAVSEGIRDENGEYVGMAAKSGAVDSFGHVYLSGVGKYLEGLVASKIGCKVRSVELNVMQRCSSHLASKCDIDEAFSIGSEAVVAGINGATGVTMVFKRQSSKPYSIKIEQTDVANIANKARDIPQSWFNSDDKAVQNEIIDYMLPLIQGDLDMIKDENGLPVYIDIK